MQVEQCIYITDSIVQYSTCSTETAMEVFIDLPTLMNYFHFDYIFVKGYLCMAIYSIDIRPLSLLFH